MTPESAPASRDHAKPLLGGRGTASHRFFDSQEGRWIVKVLPGEYYVTADESEVVATVLGSCVSACIRDPKSGFGGLNHFMLPEDKGGGWSGDNASLRYGTFAMERLINEILRTGCARGSLEIKLFGGATLNMGASSVGMQNAAFVRRFLTQEGLTIAGEDLGGPYARRINYYPTEGRVRRKFVTDVTEPEIVRQESSYKKHIATAEEAGDVELFE